MNDRDFITYAAFGTTERNQAERRNASLWKDVVAAIVVAIIFLVAAGMAS